MDAMVTARVPAEIKKQANRALEALGVSQTEAINALFEYIASNQSLPDFRSDEKKLYEGRERVIDPATMTPKMLKTLSAMRRIRELPPIDWGDDADKPTQQLIDEARSEHLETIFRY